MIKRYMGVRYELVMTLPSSYGYGLVHLLVYSKLHKDWFISCRRDYTSSPYHTVPVAEPRPRNCLKCDPMIKRVFGE